MEFLFLFVLAFLALFLYSLGVWLLVKAYFPKYNIGYWNTVVLLIILRLAWLFMTFEVP